MPMMDWYTAGASEKQKPSGPSFKIDWQSATWSCIRRKPKSFTARTGNAKRHIRTSSLTSSGIAFGPDGSRCDTHPGISKNGLSLYITSNRPGGVNGANPHGIYEIWVSPRASLDAPWETPVNLDAFNSVPVI